MMKFLPTFLIIFLPIISCAPSMDSTDLDAQDDLTEDEFEEYFLLPTVDDPEEHAAREEALKKNEKEVKEVNEEFLAGKKTWFDAINEFSDLPDDEFEAEKTGAIIPTEYGRGLIEPTGADRVDPESEAYFAAFRASMNRAEVPSSFSSVDQGHVSPVKAQLLCGSCAAFANMALIETCFHRITGVFGDYSEQQMLDCGYGKNGAKGCKGASVHSYVKWATDSGKDLISEASYPYLNKKPKLTCPANLPRYNKGAKVTGNYYTYSGDEETMKALVAEHGAVVSCVRSKGPFGLYKGGVFAGCTGSEIDHAITVVGYGTDSDSGMDYWLIKNSWGAGWGEKGFIRLQRGVGMCGIGKSLITVKCGLVSGPTDPTPTTEKPCFDMSGKCGEMAAHSCYQKRMKAGCPKSCGLCKGMTPAASNSCYNRYPNCAKICNWRKNIADECKKACGKC